MNAVRRPMLGIALFALAACSSGGGGPSEPLAGFGNQVHEVALQPSVREVSGDAGLTVVALVDDVLTLEDTPEARALAVGDVLVSFDGAGFARRVVTVPAASSEAALAGTPEAGLLEFVTEFIEDIGEAFAELDFEFRVDDVELVGDFSNTTLLQASNGSVVVKEGRVTMHPRVAGHIDVGAETADTVYTVDVEIVIEPEFVAQQEFEKKKDQEIESLQLERIVLVPMPVPLPPLPVNVRAEWFVGAEFKGSAEVEVRKRMVWTGTLSGGAHYRPESGWSINPTQTDFQLQDEPLEMTGELAASLELWLECKVTIAPLDLAGLRLHTRPYVRGEWDAKFPFGEEYRSTGRTVRVGLDGKLVAFVAWFGEEEESATEASEKTKEFELYDVELLEISQQERLIHGHVFGANALPLSGTRVFGGSLGEVTTDADGFYVFEEVGKGTWYVAIGADFEPERHEVEVTKEDHEVDFTAAGASFIEFDLPQSGLSGRHTLGVPSGEWEFDGGISVAGPGIFEMGIDGGSNTGDRELGLYCASFCYTGPGTYSDVPWITGISVDTYPAEHGYIPWIECWNPQSSRPHFRQIGSATFTVRDDGDTLTVWGSLSSAPIDYDSGSNENCEASVLSGSGRISFRLAHYPKSLIEPCVDCESCCGLVWDPEEGWVCRGSSSESASAAGRKLRPAPWRARSGRNTVSSDHPASAALAGMRAERDRRTATSGTARRGAQTIAFLPLSADVDTIDGMRGGRQELTLEVPPSLDGADVFVFLTSATGMRPGLPLAPGFTLPLNPDPWTEAQVAGVGFLSPHTGPVPPHRRVRAAFVLPPHALPEQLLGTQLHHAAVVLDTDDGDVVLVSNAVPLTLR